MALPVALLLHLAAAQPSFAQLPPAVGRRPPVNITTQHKTARPVATHAHPPAVAGKPQGSTPAPATEPQPVQQAETAKGTATGLVLPRFASLRSDDVNLRTGPGERYPIEWVYRRRDLPVRIEREFEIWRLISDFEGTKGWVHQATLVGRRTFIVTGGDQVIRTDPDDAAQPAARVKSGVIGRIRSCDANSAWCQVQVGDYHGWLKRSAFWGVVPGEAVQ